LRKFFELANIDFTDQRRNILIVFIARFGFADGDLVEPLWI